VLRLALRVSRLRSHSLGGGKARCLGGSDSIIIETLFSSHLSDNRFYPRASASEIEKVTQRTGKWILRLIPNK